MLDETIVQFLETVVKPFNIQFCCCHDLRNHHDFVFVVVVSGLVGIFTDAIQTKWIRRLFFRLVTNALHTHSVAMLLLLLLLY
jgi:hypothetical protein